ncbi:hypothetical protein [Bradyrhizobium sp. MOS001]|uniref:hypothetical protein n=1 Tax=Bradyrhizobium sp. MOS001 TaxID=2133948 RepID=UPI001431A58F
MQLEPALLNRMLDAGAELRPGGLERIEKRSIELFDVNATVLDSFNGLCELGQFAGSGVRSGKGAFGAVSFMQIDYQILRPKAELLHPHLWFWPCILM